MKSPGSQKELIHYLCRHYGFSESVAIQLVAEVQAYNSQTCEEFIHQRHHELQESGIANKTAYQLIQKELTERRFPAPEFTERQIRRIIYG